MAKLSKEQKASAIKELETYNHVAFMCDGYEVALRIQRHKMKLVVGIFVNGDIKGCWCNEHEKHPEAKYLAPYFINVWKSKSKQELIKTYGKREAYKRFPDLDDKNEYRLPYFSSALRAVNHLIKVSDSIELIGEMVA